MRTSSRPCRPPLALVLALVSVAVAAACGGGEMESDEMDAVPAPITGAEIDALRNGFLEAMDAGDFTAAAAFYTEDAVFHHPDGTKSRGRAEIQEHLAAMGESGTASDVALTPTDMGAGPSVAWETGTFSATITPETGEPVPVSSNYLIVVERQPDGSVRLVQDAEWPTPGEGDGQGM